MNILRAATAALALSCAPVAAAEFNTVAGYPTSIIMTGEIFAGDDAKLANVLQYRAQRGLVTEVLSLHSGGGRLLPASTMAHLIRSLNIATSVPADAECSSACMLIFAGGAYRYVWRGGHLGVHSASLDGADNLQDTTILAREMAAYGAPPAVTGKLVTTPSDDISWLTESDIAGWVTVGNPQEEVQVASAADTTSMMCRSTKSGKTYPVAYDGSTIWINGKPHESTGWYAQTVTGTTKYGIVSVQFGGKRMVYSDTKGREAIDQCW